MELCVTCAYQLELKTLSAFCRSDVGHSHDAILPNQHSRIKKKKTYLDQIIIAMFN